MSVQSVPTCFFDQAHTAIELAEVGEETLVLTVAESDRKRTHRTASCILDKERGTRLLQILAQRLGFQLSPAN